ncbi:hypothetical protein CEXT_137121 [Caerostris extrusa]|uniref:Uncharacterized protein n=1 Tax=Caerostris extrusa TaxID=172846 RepID=A0AAV4UBX4_CAEEX|nr:hypothetical protein CEXT_137121 [Caerostris extrusa]
MNSSMRTFIPPAGLATPTRILKARLSEGKVKDVVRGYPTLEAAPSHYLTQWFLNNLHFPRESRDQVVDIGIRIPGQLSALRLPSSPLTCHSDF